MNNLFKLLPHDGVRLPSDEEGEAAVLAAAHLDLGAGGGLDTSQLLVGVISKSFETLPLLRGDVEHLAVGYV